MKFALALLALAAAAGIYNNDGVKNSDRKFDNQKTRAPIPRPNGSSKQFDQQHNRRAQQRGRLAKIAEQARKNRMPTARPTSYPTKSSEKACAYKNGFVHVGWKGPGEDEKYCNLWECMTRGGTKSAGGGFTLAYSSPHFPTKAKGSCNRHGCGMSESDFNKRVKAAPHRIVKRECLDCHGDYKNVYYRRTGDNNVNYYGLFHKLWASRNNRLNKDFELYSTYKDALKRTNKWQFCNYDDRRWMIGFPRDCGPRGGRGWQWNSRKHGGPRRRYAYFVEKKASGAYWRKTNRVCKLVKKRSEKTCSDTMCKFVYSPPAQEILHYSFDSATQRFKNILFDPSKLSGAHLVTKEKQHLFSTYYTTRQFRGLKFNSWGRHYWYTYGWDYVTFANHYYSLYTNIVGKCKLQRWKGNMAWHVSNNAAHPWTSETGYRMCQLNSKSAIKVPKQFNECKFSMVVRDVDFIGYGHWTRGFNSQKEADDYMCFEVTDKDGNSLAGYDEKCQRDDITRRLTEARFLGFHRQDRHYTYERHITLGQMTIDRTISHWYTDKARKLETQWIPRDAFKTGFKFRIWAQSNHELEHWYADDLRVNCH